jgi:NADPH-dependent 2,4-dienoyl-CoA reductase/sulfur reductase-like enzyme/Fe-S-cluster-containing hydrogenase component 2
MKRYDLIIIGAGPAGLSAGIEAAKHGLNVVIYDENNRPGGQLFKQIHKFFGSKEHKAKIRGFKIGEELLREAESAGVEVILNAVVIGIYPNKEVVVMTADYITHVKGDAIITATGASENVVSFDGWTLPGVIGAGAAQTMMNLHGVKPGNKIFMLGSGNVGLVVGFQLIQAGCELVAVADAAKSIGGYGVHASKLARCGVPFYMSHTILKVDGSGSENGERVKKVIIGEVNERWEVITGTEKTFEADTVCLAVGLSPMSQLLDMAGCQMLNDPKRGGTVPVLNQYGETSIDGIYAAGDVSGIEEASAAMITGRLAGASAAFKGGFLDEKEFLNSAEKYKAALGELRRGMFAPDKKGDSSVTKTDEGIPLSKSLLKKGYIDDDEASNFPYMSGYTGNIKPSKSRAVIECTQNIPCNPCQDSCPKKCIKVGNDITALPIIDENAECSGCGMCIASCSGQAIFLVSEDSENNDFGFVTMPYEFMPLPVKGEVGDGYDRSGKPVCSAQVVDIKRTKAMDMTNLLTVRVPLDMISKVRFYKGGAKV